MGESVISSVRLGSQVEGDPWFQNVFLGEHFSEVSQSKKKKCFF